MTVTHAYVPTALRALAGIVAAGGIGPVPVLAHAVTEALRDHLPDAGEDEREYAALSAAALDSIGMIEEEDPPRRVVIAVDAATVVPVPGGAPTLVEILEVVPIARIAAVHVDSEEAENDVAEAHSRWVADGATSEVTQAAVERSLDHELGWYATQEIDDLVAE